MDFSTITTTIKRVIHILAFFKKLPVPTTMIDELLDELNDIACAVAAGGNTDEIILSSEHVAKLIAAMLHFPIPETYLDEATALLLQLLGHHVPHVPEANAVSVTP